MPPDPERALELPGDRRGLRRSLRGFGRLLARIPKAALGALVLWLGLDLLRQWLWDLRKESSRADLAQLASILVCVIVSGYVVGFLAGLLAACIFFVVNYSQLPYIRLDTTLATARSPLIRDAADQAYITEAGAACRIGRCEGFIFFGVAIRSTSGTARRHWGSFRSWCWIFPTPMASTSRPSQVLQKIARNEAARHQHLIMALSDAIAPALRLVTRQQEGGPALVHSFDAALELAEEILQQQRAAASPALGCRLHHR